MEENITKAIYPMMFKIDGRVKENIYYLSLPKYIKDKWVELEKASKFNKLTNFNLNIYTLKNMLNTHLDGVIGMDSISTNSDDSKWIKSFKSINKKRVLSCFRIWVEEFYINGSLSNDRKRKNGTDENVNKLANELLELIKYENFGDEVKEELVLFENGKAVNNEGFTLYPLKVINDLMGRTININGISTKLLYSRQNELITDTKDIFYKDSYISFVIKLSIQTLPPKNNVYLNVDLSVRRWSKNITENSLPYLPTDKICYIRVGNDRMQELKGGYNNKQKKLTWVDTDYNCFKQCHLSCKVPQFDQVLLNLEKYNNGKINDVLVPYKDDISGVITRYDAGVTFNDRDTVFKFIMNYLYENNSESKYVKAIPTKRINIGNPKAFRNKDYEINKELFLNQLDKALDSKILTIEIYIDDEIIESMESKFDINDLKNDIDKYLNKYLEGSQHEIIFSSVTNILKKLDKTEDSKKDNLVGFEKRVEEINNTLNKVTNPTLALVFINNKDYYKKIDKSISLDPKYAIRCGFAERGRLTQFITLDKYNEEYNRISNLENEKKKRELVSNKINKVLHTGILDGFRQLGIIYDYSENKKLKGKNIVGVHISNYKKTIYNGVIGQFPIIIRYDVDNSRLYGYCDLVDKVEVPYWKLNLGMAKIASKKDIYSFLKENMSDTSLYRRLDRIINKLDKETIMIIDSNGTSRNFVKGIANSEIEKANTDNGCYELLLKDNQYLKLDNSHNLSLIRIRHNNEVPSYIPIKNEDNNYLQTSGIYKYEDVYYAIESRPQHESKVYKDGKSKIDSTESFSHRNMMELYPIFISNKSEDKELDVISIVRKLKSNAIQFDSSETVLPLPLHLALKSEEYLYTIR